MTISAATRKVLRNTSGTPSGELRAQILPPSAPAPDDAAWPAEAFVVRGASQLQACPTMRPLCNDGVQNGGEAEVDWYISC